MTIWQSMRQAVRFYREARTTWRPSSGDPALVALFGGSPASSGVTVTTDGAISLMAVWDGVRLLSETLGSLPLLLYRRLDRGKARASDHWLYRVLHTQPNPEQTSMEWRQTMAVHQILWGNCYSEIQRDAAGRIVALWPLHPDRVRPFRAKTDGRLYYEISTAGLSSSDPDKPTNPILRADQMFHVRDLSFNGVTGTNPMLAAREMLGLSLALQESGARFFGNGAYQGGVLQTDKKISKEAYKRLEESISQKHGGLSNMHRLAILEDGLKWQQTTVDPEKAQSLESRKFQTIEVARWLNVPPHFLKDLERATFSNIEHQGIEFVIYSIRPRLVRWEQRILTDLVPPEEQDTIYAEFLVDALLRGDLKSRYDAYAVGRQNGWLSANDVLELENRNPIANGDIYLQPVNMVEAGSAPPDSNAPTRAIDPKRNGHGLLTEDHAHA